MVVLWIAASYLDVVDTKGCDAGDAGAGDTRWLQAEHGLKPCFQLGYGRRHDDPTRLELMLGFVWTLVGVKARWPDSLNTIRDIRDDLGSCHFLAPRSRCHRHQIGMTRFPPETVMPSRGRLKA